MVANPEIEPRLTRIASRQHGLVTREQALATGLAPRAIARRVQAGRWTALRWGVYRIAGSPVTWEQAVLAACLATRGVASHATAAVLFGIPGARRRPLEVIVPFGSGARRTHGAVVHRARHFDPPDRATVRKIPTTSPARTLMDLAERLPGGVLAEAVDDVLCRNLCSLRNIEAAMARAGSRRAGRGRLQQVLAAWEPGATPGSPAEMRLVRILKDSGLPSPSRQYEVYHNDELLARVDLAWPEARVALELDSWRWHGGRRPFDDDRARALRLAASGWQVLSVTPVNLADGQGSSVCDAVRSALRAGPPGSRPRRLSA